MTRAKLCWMIAVLLAAVGIGAVCGTDTSAQQAEKKAEPKADKEKGGSDKKTLMKTFMRRKLESSQRILEGIATEDYDMIARGARELKGISAAAEFVVSKDVIYTQHSDEFRRIADQLERRAREKRLDGSALAYMDLTLSCVECHRFVRNVLVAKGDSP